MTVGDLLAFAKAHPAGNGARVFRRLGRKCGYPPCCIEFFVAVVPLLYPPPSFPPVAAYWKLANPGARDGHVPCPACLGVPLTEELAGDDEAVDAFLNSARVQAALQVTRNP